jgi:hypothetical protein
LEVSTFHAYLTPLRLNQGKETGRKQGMQVLANKQKTITGLVVGKINEDETEFMAFEKNEGNKIINCLTENTN